MEFYGLTQPWLPFDLLRSFQLLPLLGGEDLSAVGLDVQEQMIFEQFGIVDVRSNEHLCGRLVGECIDQGLYAQDFQVLDRVLVGRVEQIQGVRFQMFDLIAVDEAKHFFADLVGDVVDFDQIRACLDHVREKHTFEHFARQGEDAAVNEELLRSHSDLDIREFARSEQFLGQGISWFGALGETEFS